LIWINELLERGPILLDSTTEVLSFFLMRLHLDQKLRDHIGNCLAQAEEAKRRADATADPDAKDDFLSLERTWKELAQHYQFSARLERFLLNHRNTAERPWKPISRAPFDCDLELAVINRDGPDVIIFPCRRVVGGYIDPRTNQRIDLNPSHWRAWKRPA
jgi:hypothetical protein